MRARPTLAALLASEAVAVWLVATRLPGAGAGAGPRPFEDPVGWLGATDPLTATLTVGRWLVLVVAGWLLLTTLVTLGARLLAAAVGTPGRVRRIADEVGRRAPGLVRHVVEAAVTVGVVAVSAGPVGAASGPATRSGSTPPVRVVASARPVVAPLGPVRVARAVSPPAPTAPPATAAPIDPAAGRHRVVAGEHLWGIAESVLAAAGVGDDPAAIARYWRALCERNRDHLASGDPDVVAPGEDLELPPVA